MSMTLISTITVSGTSTNSVSFDNIPQNGTDLLLVLSMRCSVNSVRRDARLSVNGSLAPGGRYVRGTGSVVSSASADPLSNAATGNSATASTFSNNSLYFPNYAGSRIKRFSIDIVTENFGIDAYQILLAGGVQSNAAITSLGVSFATGENFVADSVLSLYKITKGSDGIVAVS